MIRLFLILILIISVMLLVTSCSDKITESKGSERFLLRVSLRDIDAKPLEGYRVSVAPKNINCEHQIEHPKIRAETTIPFTTLEDYKVTLIIYDYFGKHTRILFDGDLLAAGNHMVMWDGRNDDRDIVRDGIYQAVIEYRKTTNEDEIVFSDSIFMYKTTERSVSVLPHTTDEKGMIEDDCILPFPVLYCEEMIPSYDEQNTFLGELILCDTVRVTVEIPDEDELFTYDFRIFNGENTINLTLDNMNRLSVEATTGGIVNSEKHLYFGTINESPPIVNIISFTATQTDQNGVKVKWMTGGETNLLGYNILRSEESSLNNAPRITYLIIPAHNVSGTGITQYKYIDEEVVLGKSYFYWLEVIDLNLSNEFYGPLAIEIKEEDDDDPPIYVNLLQQNFPNPFN